MQLKLIFPPSVNDMFLNNKGGGKGRILSPEYRAWINASGLMLNRQRPTPITERCIILIQLDDTRRGDCDNRIKPCLDLLVRHKIIQGDQKKHVKGVWVSWEPVQECIVEIIEASKSPLFLNGD